MTSVQAAFVSGIIGQQRLRILIAACECGHIAVAVIVHLDFRVYTQEHGATLALLSS